MEKTYAVYILTNKQNGILYVGITGKLAIRIWQHKNKIFKGFTEKYELDKLVYYRIFYDVYNAIHFEKQLKKWRREWKLKLIEKDNPYWEDLYEKFVK